MKIDPALASAVILSTITDAFGFLSFLGLATLYLIFQNAIGVSIAAATGLSPLMGLIGGSVTLSGGHGNGATYSDLFINEYGMPGSVFELAMAAATLGLILGGKPLFTISLLVLLTVWKIN